MAARQSTKAFLYIIESKYFKLNSQTEEATERRSTIPVDVTLATCAILHMRSKDSFSPHGPSLQRSLQIHRPAPDLRRLRRWLPRISWQTRPRTAEPPRADAQNDGARSRRFRAAPGTTRSRRRKCFDCAAAAYRGGAARFFGGIVCGGSGNAARKNSDSEISGTASGASRRGSDVPFAARIWRGRGGAPQAHCVDRIARRWKVYVGIAAWC